MQYEFTTDWFVSNSKANWDTLLDQNATRVLEIGAYEGASACYLIDRLGANPGLEIHCVDTWEGSIEHQPEQSASADMGLVEMRFKKNTALALSRFKVPPQLLAVRNFSHLYLAELLASGKSGYFDFIYVDGSHRAPDVLLDATLGFQLLKQGGVMGFDDYLWTFPIEQPRSIVDSPKLAIDSFVNVNFQKLTVLRTSMSQVYIQKTAS